MLKSINKIESEAHKNINLQSFKKYKHQLIDGKCKIMVFSMLLKMETDNKL